jgi:hypothetical protein
MMHTQRHARKNSHRHDHHNNKTQREKKPTHTHTNRKHTQKTKQSSKILKCSYAIQAQNQAISCPFALQLRFDLQTVLCFAIWVLGFCRFFFFFPLKLLYISLSLFYSHEQIHCKLSKYCCSFLQTWSLRNSCNSCSQEASKNCFCSQFESSKTQIRKNCCYKKVFQCQIHTLDFDDHHHHQICGARRIPVTRTTLAKYLSDDADQIVLQKV